ncbi:tRNA (adenosine(37)-N6)-threonylcarbamoyltransferase complex ATPase subunit type 1 TsaE [Acidocella sp.]|uniref:tRNA (adenosine(37)-N6)-threonylcarbamoyltransferase complex ATPase subunit type 1 TsaE n=1 Tax=Acidocella sp. TaxID=50710 RepID=UPI00262FA0CE|nr:tRNA (adenosine(37)-N6)-threonylcarbamoyltransferase complex ATPase subunit type 1 TsaE [Acidocella sp.]
MRETRVTLADEAATSRLGRQLAARARPGDVILLDGPLGAGKSTLARAFIRALADDERLAVPSPTFTLVQVYETPRGEVWHYDLWRLSGPDALAELGWDEALDGGIVLVEWAGRLGGQAPAGALRLALDAQGAGRVAVLTGEERWFDGL